MNRRSFIGLILALPLVRHLKPEPKALSLLQDVEWCNDPSFIGHRVTSRSALPHVRYARLVANPFPPARKWFTLKDAI